MERCRASYCSLLECFLLAIHENLKVFTNHVGALCAYSISWFLRLFSPCLSVYLSVIVRDELEQEFSFRFESIVREHHVYKGALNKLISEMRLTTREYGMYWTWQIPADSCSSN